MDIKKEILEILSDYVEIDPETFDTSSSFKFSAGLDSFALIALVGAIEDHFGITIPTNNLRSLKTVDDLSACVSENLGLTDNSAQSS